MPTVLFYTKKQCPLCDNAKANLWILQQEYAFTIEERDIESRIEWFQAFQFSVPVVELNGRQLDGESMSHEALEQFVQANS